MDFQIGDLFYIELFARKLKTVNGKRKLEYEDILSETKTACILDIDYSYGPDDNSPLTIKTKLFKLRFSNGSVSYFPRKYLESFFEQPRMCEKWTYYPVNT